MNSQIQGKYYLFYIRDTLPQPEAHIVQMVHLANAAANLGHQAVLVYLQKGSQAFSPLDVIFPFRPRQPEEALRNYYNLESKLQVSPLPMPYPIDAIKSKFFDSSTLSCKYYLPFHLSRGTKLVHSRDWNFVKAAVKQGIPAIYERDHYEQKRYEAEIVNNPLFKMAVTVADPVKDNLISNGMPPEKVIKLHNGFNRLFFARHPEAALEWRKKLLQNQYQQLVVYAGALYPFKGINLLIDIAPQFPQVIFALAGGSEEQIQEYKQLIQDKKANNVKLLGYLPHNFLASLLQAADALVYPHLAGEAANFTSPMKLFDYIAAGKPIVATTIPPLAEFKSSPLVAGWCEPNNPQAFADSLRQVLATYPQWQIEHIHDEELVQQFSWEYRIEKLLTKVFV